MAHTGLERSEVSSQAEKLMRTQDDMTWILCDVATEVAGKDHSALRTANQATDYK